MLKIQSKGLRQENFITDIIEKSGNYSVTAGLNSFYPVILEEYAIKLKPDVVVLGAYTDENEARRYFPKTKIVKMTTDKKENSPVSDFIY